MLMFTEPKKEIRPIDRSDLLTFAQVVKRFLNYYEKYIYINNDETREKLILLRKYVDVLLMERYDLLIRDTSIINDDLSVGGEQKIDWRNLTNEDIESILNDPTLPF